ncbi:MAG: hypothetical protein M3M99_01975 [Actinomycetota bacterium]|nr:hypothetical protein [Actinomycetota bacterium]
MPDSGSQGKGQEQAANRQSDEPGSETERFRALIDLRHNEAITGESGVPRRQRDHELRRQLSSLDEFS